MNIRQLKIFKAVCDEMNFTRAAEMLYMTQPAVSRAISELEGEIGCCLFDRLAHKIYLTGPGSMFLDRVVRILELYDDLEDNFYASEDRCPVRVGSSITIGGFWLPGIAERFRFKCPDAKMSVYIDRAADVEARLLANEIDIGLIEGSVADESLMSVPFASYEMAVVCSSRHEFAKRGSITAEELMTCCLILRERGSAIRDTFDSALWLKGLRASPSWTGINSQALIQAVKRNLGVTVMPKILTEREVRDGELVMIDVQDMRLENKNYVAYHKGKYLTSSMRSFIEAVKAE